MGDIVDDIDPVRIGTLGAFGSGDVSGAWEDVTGQTAANEAGEAVEASTQASIQMQREALAQQQQQYETSRQDWLGFIGQQREDYAPWLQAGQGALSQIQELLGSPEAMAANPTYQSAMQLGQRAIESSGAARGMQLSSATLEQLPSASFQARQQVLGELMGLAGLGQQGQAVGTGAAGTGFSGLMGAGQTYSQGIGSAYTNMGTMQQQLGMTQAANIMGGYQGMMGLIGGGLGAVAALA